MQRLVVDAREPEAGLLRAAAEFVRAGKVVAYPTDTLYGLAVDPRNAAAVERLYDVKQRPAERALPLIAADSDAAHSAGAFTPLAVRLAAAFWPGPLTIIVPAAPDLATAVHGGTGRVAVRVPGHLVAARLASAAGGLVTATSANLSGQPASRNPEDVATLASTGLDLLLDAGPSPGGLASTIVDATGAVPLLVRAGAVPWERVLEFLDTARGR